MVGASLKSRSSVESCWFSDRTTPRSRGEDFKTQNGKNNVRTVIISELPNLSQKPGRLARCFSRVRNTLLLHATKRPIYTGVSVT